MRRPLLTIALLALALVPFGAADASARGPFVRVLECRDGGTSASRSAKFLGRMHAVPGTDRMAMRFTLLERFGDERTHTVDLPELHAWRFAKAGIKDFRFRQTVAELNGGG